MKMTAVSALALSAALAFTPALFANAAETPPSPPMMHQDGKMAHGPRIDPALMAEGRIAFLRAVLQITPAQAPQFDKFAAVVRKHAAERAKMWQDRMGMDRDDMTAPQRLDQMSARLATHEKNLAEMKAVLDPLYAALTPAQKATADVLLSHGPMMMMHHFGGGMGKMGGHHGGHDDD